MASLTIQQFVITSLLLQFNTIINRTVIFISLRTLGSCHLVHKDETTPYHFVLNHGFSFGYMLQKNYANGHLTANYLSLLF